MGAFVTMLFSKIQYLAYFLDLFLWLACLDQFFKCLNSCMHGLISSSVPTGSGQSGYRGQMGHFFSPGHAGYQVKLKSDPSL